MRTRRHLAVLFAAVGGAWLSLSAAGDVFTAGDVDPVVPSASQNLYIGVADGSFGSMLVEFGGLASNQSGYVGFGKGSVGSVSVTDEDSAWINAGTLNVGHLGMGALGISAGGAVSAMSSYIAAYEGSSGTATVGDPGTTWTTSFGLHIGNAGDGTLTVQSGAKVSAMDIDLGFAAGVTGSATVQGAGSELKATAYLNVGGHGVGTVTARDGAAIVNQHGYIGTDLRPPDNSAGANGSVTVDNATWTNTGTLVVSFTSPGSLSVTNGGEVSAGVSIKLFGAGTIDLDGGTLAAPVIDNGGTIRGNGTIAGDVSSAGTIDVGHSVGAMRIMGSYGQFAGGVLIVDIDADDRFDVLTVDGQAALGGQLMLRFNYEPAGGQTYEFLRAAGISGETWSWSVSGIDASRISVAGGSVTVAVPEPGSTAAVAMLAGMLLRRRRIAV